MQQSRRGKKIAEEVESQLSVSIGDRTFPVEYTDYQLAMRLRCRIKEVEEMPVEEYDRYILFMNAEARAAKLRAHQAKLYGK